MSDSSIGDDSLLHAIDQQTEPPKPQRASQRINSHPSTSKHKISVKKARKPTQPGENEIQRLARQLENGDLTVNSQGDLTMNNKPMDLPTTSKSKTKLITETTQTKTNKNKEEPNQPPPTIRVTTPDPDNNTDENDLNTTDPETRLTRTASHQYILELTSNPEKNEVKPPEEIINTNINDIKLPSELTINDSISAMKVKFYGEEDLPNFPTGSKALNAFRTLRDLTQKYVRTKYHIMYLSWCQASGETPRGIRINKSISLINETPTTKLQINNILTTAEISIQTVMKEHYEQLAPALFKDIKSIVIMHKNIPSKEMSLLILKLAHEKNQLLETLEERFKKKTRNPVKTAEDKTEEEEETPTTSATTYRGKGKRAPGPGKWPRRT